MIHEKHLAIDNVDRKSGDVKAAVNFDLANDALSKREYHVSLRVIAVYGYSWNFAHGTFLIVTRSGLRLLGSHARTIIILLTEDPARFILARDFSQKGQ